MLLYTSYVCIYMYESTNPQLIGFIVIQYLFVMCPTYFMMEIQKINVLRK